MRRPVFADLPGHDPGLTRTAYCQSLIFELPESLDTVRRFMPHISIYLRHFDELLARYPAGIVRIGLE